MIFRSGGLELDTDRFSVTKDKQSITVEPKVFDLLVYLMTHHDQLVARDQLLEALWPGRIIHDNVLSNDIKLARAALGDDGEQQKFIKTIRGRGYQFIGEVETLEADSDPVTAPPQQDDSPAPLPNSAGSRSSGFHSPSRLVIAAVLVAILLTIVWQNLDREPAVESPSETASDSLNAIPLEQREKTVAILPFANRSNLQEDVFFTDGFHDDLITQVSKIKELAVISRTSVMPYRDSNKGMRNIGKELGSGVIIEGGVQRAGEQVRINVQMIDAVKDEHMWAETYTRQLSAQSVFAIQSEIALEVASQLQAVLSPEEQENLANQPTDNIVALEAYFRGLSAVYHFTSEGFSQAIKHFQYAIDLDPDFADAHAQLGMALLHKIGFGRLPWKEQINLAEPVINRALELNPELSAAYEALAILEREKGNHAATEAAYKKAIELNPSRVSALHGFAYFKSAILWQFEEALELMERARLVDPQNSSDPLALVLNSQVLDGLGRYQESLALLETARANHPEFALVHYSLGTLLHEKLYQLDRAVQSLRQFVFLDPDTRWVLVNLGTVYEELGLIDEAKGAYVLYLDGRETGVLPYIARYRLHLLRGEEQLAKQEFEAIRREFGGQWVWADTMLSGFDLQQDNPQQVIQLVKTTYPQLTGSEMDYLNDGGLFNLAITYAAALHLVGEQKQAAPLTEKILEMLPTLNRHRWHGVQTLDTWLHVAMGNDDKAIESLREWRKIGARTDLTKHRMVPRSLFDHPEFQSINQQMLADIAEQRANLARMEANGEIAPMPKLTPGG